jgi:hypothetical protein
MAAIGFGAPAWAIIIQNGKTGLFGLAAGQTVRISVLNASDKGGIQPCVGIFDLSGNQVAEAEGSSAGPGEGTFVDFDARSLGIIDDGQREQLRAVVEVDQPPDPGSPDGRVPRIRPDDVLFTLEVFDTATGRTAFTVPFEGTRGAPTTDDGTR